MKTIDKESIEKVITNSLFSENDEKNKAVKNSLLSIMNELCTYTQEVNQKLISEAFIKETDYKIHDLYTVILPVGDDTEYEAVGLYKMADYNERRIFLDCEYDEIKNIVGDLSDKKIYKGRYIKNGKLQQFEYSFKFDNSFIVLQERLYSYAEHFCIKNPVILSPYSHKAFWLVFDESIIEDDTEPDFQFEENNIPALTGKCLYWNIKQKFENERTYDSKEPYGDKIKYIYTFKKTKKGSYVLPLPLNNQTCIYEIKYNDTSSEIITDHDVDSFLIIEYIDLDLNSRLVKERQSKNLLFSNEISERLWENHRIISEGDIERAIGGFRDWQNIICERSDGNGKIILRYSKKYRADRKNKNMFNAIHREYLRINKISGRFLTDYANYILEYLEFFYPEIEWAGEE